MKGPFFQTVNKTVKSSAKLTKGNIEKTHINIRRGGKRHYNRYYRNPDIIRKYFLIIVRCTVKLERNEQISKHIIDHN